MRCSSIARLLLACIAVADGAKKDKDKWEKEVQADVQNEKKDKVEVKGPVIGIDLGTTYSCVAIYKNGEVSVLANDQGNRITPSYAAYDADGSRLIGEAAKNQAADNSDSTAFDVKRLIGRLYTDASVQSDAKLLPYKIVAQNNKPHIRMAHAPRSSKLLAPEEISAMVLGKMKETAENYLGTAVENAVITVPAYFNDLQRQATKDAGAVAGLNVLRIINEPTAAAFAYGLDQEAEVKEKTVLVFDLGGGTFDVSLLTIDKGVFEVLATSGDTHLGGEDFDQRIVNHLVELFKKKHGKDLSKNKRALTRLRRESEKAKRVLSSQYDARIEVEAIVDGIDFSERLSRAQFEKLCLDLFKKTIKPVEQVLKDSGIKKSEVQELIMVGGSTRIPKVQELLKDAFDGKELNVRINPDEAVAYGAAVQAGILSGEAGMQNILLLDVIPLSLGVGEPGGRMEVFIPRNTHIPTSHTEEYTNRDDEQDGVDFDIYQGERPLCKDNIHLAASSLNFPPVAKGEAKVTVNFDVDHDGILTVRVADDLSGKSKRIKIDHRSSRLSGRDIEKMLREADRNKEDDERIKQKFDAEDTFRSYLESLKKLCDDNEGKYAEEDIHVIKEAVSKSIRWLEKYVPAPKTTAGQVKGAQKEVEFKMNPIIQKYTQYGSNKEDHPVEATDDADTGTNIGEL